MGPILIPKEITISNFILSVNQPIKVGKKKEDKHTSNVENPFKLTVEQEDKLEIRSRHNIYVVHGTILILKVKLGTRSCNVQHT